MSSNYGYVYGVDVWEGSLNAEPGVLKDNGIEFAVIRLNSMVGGHRVDKQFVRQWVEYDQLIRWPYFVYNPWVSGKANFEFLAKTAPKCHAMSLDIEVRNEGYSPKKYAEEVAAFCKLAAGEWNINIYTGMWFLPYLSAWPAYYEYWWAQYPYTLYPKAGTRITWEKLFEKINSLKLFPVRSPGPCRLRQVTADRYILPGCGNRSIDVNVWNGSLEELRVWATGSGGKVTYTSWEESIDNWARTMGYTGRGPKI
jgi:hypothetical protein